MERANYSNTRHGAEYLGAEMPEQWMRAMPCEDGAERRRELRVFISEKNKIVLNAPPGEMAALNVRQIYALKQLLTEAEIEATYRAGGR